MKLAIKTGSLAFRLSCWYAVSAFLLLLVITVFLYVGLVRSFDRENNQYLEGEVRTLQALLREHPQTFDTVQSEVKGESLAHASIRVLSRITSSNGSVLTETDGMSRELGLEVFPPPSLLLTALPPSKEIRTPTGRTFQVLSAVVPAHGGDALRGYTVQVAIDLTIQKRLLARYRGKLWIVLGLGLVACILIGYRIAYEGIRPVKEISNTIARTRLPDFSERVKLEGLPTELRDLAAVFDELMDRLNDSFGRLSRFSADIAHELRTPVNNLLGEIHVAMSRVRSPAEYQDLLGSLSEESDQLKTLIDSLLFLARAEHPETEINREVLDVGREVELVRNF
jgi:two-component system heavy metal sensor histidine kinase CusS